MIHSAASECVRGTSSIIHIIAFSAFGTETGRIQSKQTIFLRIIGTDSTIVETISVDALQTFVHGLGNFSTE
jgi:hypothetical protein